MIKTYTGPFNQSSGARTPQERGQNPSDPLDNDDDQIQDISAILHGDKARKAQYTAMRGEVTSTLVGREKDQRQKRDADQARSIERIAKWNVATTMVGGVRMTNEEALTARRNVRDNADQYADWAVRNGHIRADEKEQFKTTSNRMAELMEREQQTGKRSAEMDQLEQTRTGRAASAAAAEYQRTKGLTSELATQQQARPREIKSAEIDSLASNKALFQTAPNLANEFANANAANSARDGKNDIAVTSPTTRNLSNSGLDL